jgi:hypothetical protein
VILSTTGTNADACPDPDAVDAVLDRTASEAVGIDLRRHVSRCPECGDRYGGLFEIDSLAPAIARGAGALARRLEWHRPLLAAALVAAAPVVFLSRAREEHATRVAGVPPPPVAVDTAAPHLVSSRRLEAEFVIDAAGIRTSIRHAGDGGSGSFEYAKTRSGRTDLCWSRRAPPSFEASGADVAAPSEKSR